MAWVAQLFNVPIGLILLVDEERTYHKALVGAGDVPRLPRLESMCSAAILQDDKVVISDYKPESCELIKPDVAQAFGLQFYAGAALQMPDGARIGMLVVIGREPRGLSPAETAVFSQLAGFVSQTIDLRGRLLLADELTAWEEAQQELTDNLDENATLARCLTSRNQRIDLDDDDTLHLIQHRLRSVVGVLRWRLAETARFAVR